MALKILYFAALLAIWTVPELTAAGCWSSVELSEISDRELDGVVVISFKDAVRCQPVRNVRIQLSGRYFETDGRGMVEMEGEDFVAEDDRDLPLMAQKEGFIPLKTALEIRAGGVVNNLFLMSKELPLHHLRFVLQWGKRPPDLDLHLQSEDFHVSFRKMRNVANQAKLDRDSLHGHGPETITLKRIAPNRKYHLFVHRYSSTGAIDGLGSVAVYRDNRLDRIVKLPDTGKRHVSILVIENRSIRYIVRPFD